MLVGLSKGQEGGRPLSNRRLTFQSFVLLFHEAHGPSITKSITTILHMLRYKHAFTAILLTALYDRLRNGLCGRFLLCYHFRRKKQEAQESSLVIQLTSDEAKTRAQLSWLLVQ